MPSLLPDPFPVRPAAGPLLGSVRPPGSKSLTCRAYVAAALADGESVLRSPLRADDTDRLLAALSTLGIEASWRGADVTIRGGAGRLPRGGRVDLGDGGTPTRFMIAAACLAAAPVVVDGSDRMRERPVAEGVEMLRALGADIRYLEHEGRLPVEVRPTTAFEGGTLDVGATASSQFVSALMLVAPWLRAGLTVRYQGPITSASYIALTRSLLRRFGVVVRDRRWIGPRADRVDPMRVRGIDLAIESDASSAVFWMAATAIVPGSRVEIAGADPASAQPDMRVLETLERAGLEWTRRDDVLVVEGPERLRPIEADFSAMPDGAVAVAAIASRATGPSRLVGLRTLRVKESDRLAALETELRRLGVDARATDDALRIAPAPAHDRPATIETYRDHRIAMAFAVLGLARAGVSIRDPACVEKSYPGFWDDLERVRDA